jgi:uracil-DNA glycosylase family 4
MDATRRRRYLHALGIEPWVSRSAVAAAEAEIAASVPTVAAVSLNPPAVPQAPFEMPRKPAAPKVVPSVVGKSVQNPLLSPEALAASLPPVPTDWEGLRAAVAGCERCKLCQTRTNTVFGVGDINAPLMVVGEGPGADEDAQGEPFVGRAGKLLDEMLKSIDRSRQAPESDRSVFIANVVKCRPPGNRDPEPDEVEACRPYLDQQLRLVKPRLIVALGRIAAQRLLDTDAPLSKLRGPLYAYGENKTPVLVTYHPAYLLRSPGEKAKSWQDLKRVHQLLRDR